MALKFPHYRQLDSKDCGPSCLRIIAKYYGKSIPLQTIRELSETTRSGSSLLGMSNAAETIGFKSMGVKISLSDLKEAPLPCVIHWDKKHFVVLYAIKKGVYHISDPGISLLKYNEKDFLNHWIEPYANDRTEEGIALLLEPSMKFYDGQWHHKGNKLSLSFLTTYLGKYKKHVVQLILGLIAGSLIQLIFPFLTQSIVDVGINNMDHNFIYLILIAQLFLFAGKISLEIIRSWILLHLSTRINISLISDFFIKLMNLPIAYFDSRITGDILQRINDHKRIENILTATSLSMAFSLINILVFGAVLAYYSGSIFLIFLGGSLLYALWINLFLNKRAAIDYQRFALVSQEQSKIIELITGMQTIKLNNSEKQKRWGWESMQAQLFKLSVKNLTLEQYQSFGSKIINEIKNIVITILSAKLVIDGEITLGMMMAISYIVGQLNTPANLVISFVRELQDAKISMERLAEIHDQEDEESDTAKKINIINHDLDIHLDRISFKYPGTTIPVLENLTLHIPAQKVTAIVGTSGSGKTTLLKILMKFYEPDDGKIKLGPHDLQKISQQSWREACGVVMQEDYIFSDSIANNIAISSDRIDRDKLSKAVRVADIIDYIQELPLSYNTKIGLEGIELSTGQKQRVLIARAVYKDPDYLFFDEATSALDANTESKVMSNLEQFFMGKTVVVIAHRLSTVKKAHQIVVLEKGAIVEIGNHDELIGKKGHYFNLIKNQLELGG